MAGGITLWDQISEINTRDQQTEARLACLEDAIVDEDLRAAVRQISETVSLYLYCIGCLGNYNQNFNEQDKKLLDDFCFSRSSVLETFKYQTEKWCPLTKRLQIFQRFKPLSDVPQISTPN